MSPDKATPIMKWSPFVDSESCEYEIHYIACSKFRDRGFVLLESSRHLWRLPKVFLRS